MNKNWKFALYGAAAGFVFYRLSVRGYPMTLPIRNLFGTISDAITTEAVV